MDVHTSNKGYRNGKQPTHAPWGGKDADLLSNSKAQNVLPPEKEVKARPKQNTHER